MQHCQGQRIEVILFSMHGFCPHQDLKQGKRRSDERLQWRGEMRGKGRSGDGREGEGRAETRRDKERGGV